jgi:hypothetical protein
LHTAGVRPVNLDRYALREGSRFDQVERYVRAVVGEQPRALADEHRDDQQIHLVDEVVLEQPPGQGAAAVHLQLTRRLGFQLAGYCAARSPKAEYKRPGTTALTRAISR